MKKTKMNKQNSIKTNLKAKGNASAHNLSKPISPSPRGQSDSSVRLVEVSLRDGLQSEPHTWPLSLRRQCALKLIEAGCKSLELGAFVSPKWVPQMQGSNTLFKQMNQQRAKNKIPAHIRFCSLVPNEQGMIAALKAQSDEVAIFTATSDSFAHHNMNCSVNESFARFAPVVELARQHHIPVRGYLSTVFGCPYEGPIKEKKVLQLIEKLIDLGVYEISLGDTIGVAHPQQVRQLLKLIGPLAKHTPMAMHFHDTRGLGIANVLVSLEGGIRIFDSSLGGIGGCPYAPSSTGNVSTEDVVYLIERMGMHTGLDLGKLIKINHWLSKKLGRKLPSRIGSVGLTLHDGERL